MDALRKALNPVAEETLDPDDWTDVQTLSHRVVEDAIGYLRDLRDRPVWQDVPADLKAFFAAPVPRLPAPLTEVYRDVAEKVMPFPLGNVHPRFWAWYMGASNFTGALGDFLSAIQGSNLGGGNHAAAFMDQQVVNWCKEMVGFPASASGTLVSGGSMANIIGLTLRGTARRALTCANRVSPPSRSPCAFMAQIKFTAVTARPWKHWGWETVPCGALRRTPNCASTLPPCGQRSRRIVRRGLNLPA